MIYNFYMRTTLDIPEDILEEARKILGFKSKTDVIIHSLRELIRKKKIEEIKDLAGKIDIDVDLHQSRRRKK
jgi:biotin synthase-like enzyme